MDTGKFISWVIFAAIAYGGYKYLGTGDVTVIPPTTQTVLDLAEAANKNIPQGGHLATGKGCTRSGGGLIKQGIYTCEIKVFASRASYAAALQTYTINLTKKDSRWQITN